MVGDAAVDIITARKLRIPSIHIIHQQNYQPENWASVQKCGPTYCCYTFSQLVNIIKFPAENLLSLESIEYKNDGNKVINLDEINYHSSEGKRFYGVALSRQENGLCDRFARGDWYHEFGSIYRSEPFLKKLANRVGQFIKHFELKENIKFDVISFVPDKKTTIPKDKMSLFVQMIDTGISIEKLFYWTDDVEGSIRNRPNKRKRTEFVKKFIRFDESKVILGKNVVVIDDQITTGATMDVITKKLRMYKANHILFISLFRMITEIKEGIKCPNCNKDLSLKRKKKDGSKFYSCVPSRFGGIGCGFIKNI